MSLLVLEGFVKALVMGSATGIACAEFSGLGEGHDGFTPRYYRGVAEAIGTISYELITRVGDRVPRRYVGGEPAWHLA